MKSRLRSGRRKQFWLIFVLTFIVTCLVSEGVLAVVNAVIDRGEHVEYTLPLYIMPFIAIAFTFLLLFLVRLHSRKSQLLIDSMNKVANGDYTVRIQPNTRDKEFNKIYENFNKMAEELSSVKTLRENFVHDFSHEFKTPISSIHGFATLLLEGGLSDEEQKKFLQIIADESVRLWHLADNTLIASKLENQSLIGETSDYRLDVQLNECIVILEREWERKKLTVTSDLQPVTIHGNSALMMQVWTNLLTNAIKFTPEGGEINVGLLWENDKVIVTVSDTGVGIPAEELGRIFDKYYRAKNSGDKEGSGLGLAICKRICVLSGGEIYAESAEGKGSTFKVVLPLKQI